MAYCSSGGPPQLTTEQSSSASVGAEGSAAQGGADDEDYGQRRAEPTGQIALIQWRMWQLLDDPASSIPVSASPTLAAAAA